MTKLVDVRNHFNSRETALNEETAFSVLNILFLQATSRSLGLDLEPSALPFAIRNLTL